MVDLHDMIVMIMTMKNTVIFVMRQLQGIVLILRLLGVAVTRDLGSRKMFTAPWL